MPYGEIHPLNLEPQPLAAGPGAVRRGLVVMVAVVAVFAVLAAIGFATGDKEDRPQPGAGGTSCGQVVDEPPDTEQRHVDGEIDYADQPPTSGDHHPMPLVSVVRVVDSDSAPEHAVERAVHNLEHGYVVVWYDPEVVDAAAVRGALDGVEERKVVAVPWDRGGLGASRPYVLAAWGHRQDCTALSAGAVEAFFAEHGGENGDAPEKAAP